MIFKASAWASLLTLAACGYQAAPSASAPKSDVVPPHGAVVTFTCSIQCNLDHGEVYSVRSTSQRLAESDLEAAQEACSTLGIAPDATPVCQSGIITSYPND